MYSNQHFYDNLANYYHLIYSDWDSSIRKQGKDLSAIIEDTWGKLNNTILDATCGIGTQSLGLGAIGYSVTASDLSPNAIKRAKREAKKRKIDISFSVTDIRSLWKHHKTQFDVVISCDNSFLHLLNDNDILRGLRNLFKCTKTGGGCLISLRDYSKGLLPASEPRFYGIRLFGKSKYIVFQTRSFYDTHHYNVNIYFVKDDSSSTCPTRVFRGKYYAISIPKMINLMKKAGFVRIKRYDDRYFQPVIVGTKPK